MIEHGLFDAKTYFFTGTTVHMTKFWGYHRLTFGYPGPKPFDGWKAGVSNLLRATQGPLMMLGPKALIQLPGRGPNLIPLACCLASTAPHPYEARDDVQRGLSCRG